MKNLNFGQILSRSEMKNLKGGESAPPPGGACYLLQSTSGTSCWYATSSNSDTLCTRVYPNGTCVMSLANGDGSCTSGCVMN